MLCVFAIDTGLGNVYKVVGSEDYVTQKSLSQKPVSQQLCSLAFIYDTTQTTVAIANLSGFCRVLSNNHWLWKKDGCQKNHPDWRQVVMDACL